LQRRRKAVFFATQAKLKNPVVPTQEQTLQVRGHFSFAPVQAVHLSHLFFLATLHNEK
jgi:hypothetical protein